MNKSEKVFTFTPTRLFEYGSILAMIISWSVNKSILWAMLHGIFSWFYVIYYALVR
jgi:prolipoprotein diacylglyceryltransferase